MKCLSTYSFLTAKRSQQYAFYFYAVGGRQKDIDLRNNKLFISYLFPHGTYKLSNAVDRDTSTMIHTSFEPNLYLDNGYEWLLVYLNSNTFQFVESVQINKRTGKLNTC